MSFNIALSGINAAQKDLDVTANNIANVNTFGFKESRAEFADVYATSIFSNGKTATGNGVKTAQVAQQFHQGSLLTTQNSLDMAIGGEGFFVTAEDPTTLTRNFTRAGAFNLNSENYVVNASGQFLQAYPVDSNGNPSSVSMAATRPLQISTSVGSPTQTDQVDMTFNLPSGGTEHDIGDFDPGNPDTYTSSTSVTTYDSLGEPHVAQTYFIKRTPDPVGPPVIAENSWDVVTYVDKKPVDIAGGTANVANASNPNTTIPTSARMVFGTDGELDPGTPVSPLPITTVALGSTNGADPTQTVTFNFNNPTQFGAAFEVSALSQNGSTVGKLTGIDIATDGLVKATFSNGSTVYMGKVAIAKFNNTQGLAQIGDTSWQATQNSGEPIAGEGNSGTFGKINSSNLEQSNVNLSTELVDLISAQRNFQANSRALEVNSTLQQTILQIR
ncbi:MULTISPECIES: flagellar hook protein FlgE [unclassified Motilimonas]|uniref:flagellar hook protein FlgE n=1 Tax=Motilimonas TaxID=1914248 RepID=UPI001E5FD278|nr:MULTISPECIES: flagellar hook protein FlgE [unclassified Motilimonas]MCE0556198.1 flagellar hook protein FlgE [Motilimonas sp. E26]MDO6524944.1 flagellar hook protein FlgE [Motilimonas sp. 1_MG-2023]